jgi:hypothetical protein
MHLIDLSMRSRSLQLISAGKDQFTVSSIYLYTPYLGNGNIGVEEIVTEILLICLLSGIIHAYSLALRVRSMKGLKVRYSAFHYMSNQQNLDIRRMIVYKLIFDHFLCMS